MSKHFRYRLFDLVLASDLKLDRLLPDESENAPDLFWKCSDFEQETFEATDQGLLWKTAPDCFELALPNVATIRVKDGHEILINLVPDAPMADVETLLLSAGVAALMQQRQVFLLHAAAFESASGAVLLAGVSGSGKSLLLSALNQRGYPMISDDITAISCTKQEAWVHPAWPKVSLMLDAFETLGLDRPEPNLGQAQGKRTFTATPFCSQKTPLDKIVFLKWTPEDAISISNLKGIEALPQLSSNVYRRTFLKGMQLLESNFTALNQIAAQAQFNTLTRPHDLRRLENVVDKLEEELGIIPSNKTHQSAQQSAAR
ncbi:hypothetical protein [Planktotalea sp.]|uniref:hypothetical protein n=1 Tax=Planktotalea sp. TaxID=2029877 RepID=UPI00329907D3